MFDVTAVQYHRGRVEYVGTTTTDAQAHVRFVGYWCSLKAEGYDACLIENFEVKPALELQLSELRSNQYALFLLR